MRRRVAAIQARSHWVCFWPAGIALSPRKLALLVEAYRVHPGERPKIGTAAELEEVRAALAGIPSR